MAKLKYILPSAAVLILFFSLAGSLRSKDTRQASTGEKLDIALDRTLANEDINMLDGFMMVLEVYPKHLDYHYGLEHLEIFMRPIPRSIWPDKPVGGYANKLELNNYEAKGTVGISQTLYGSFYGEGGLVGIVIFSLIYGKVIAWLLSLAERYKSDMKYIIRGVVFASLIPLLRGGDLPGIFAFIGMSFWPVFLFIRGYNKFLKTQISISGKFDKIK